ncbi:thioesterase family protein [Microvirga terricola]|uniref:Thioesterase n=1 Tax=Microvirga terricola TaxID=2719797 RepID=A0ABX0V7Z7_9HYPH|nr:thioesterase family protein [Microvirga terricola]NIX75944.1 thioesterase [Microvirga terricola]
MAAPWISVRETVRDEWVDFNGHMTNAAYVAAFDIASVALLHRVGIDPVYRDAKRCSTFALELHTVFHRELPPKAPYEIETRVLDFDAKRIHLFHQIKHAQENFLAASLEVVTIHVDLNQRRSTPLPTEIVDRLTDFRRASDALGWPEIAGRRVGLKRD